MSDNKIYKDIVNSVKHLYKEPDKEYTITDKQLYNLCKSIQESSFEAILNEEYGATDDFDHVFEQYFSLSVWVKKNLKEMK